MLSKQQVFDIVAEHLRVQAKQALNEHGACCYRGTDGTKCAAGILIRDEHYSPDIEGLNCRTDEVLALLPAASQHISSLGELQVIHDRYKPVDWHANLTNVARFHQLDDEVLKPGGKPETLRQWLAGEIR